MSPKVKRGLQKAPKDGSKLSAALQPEKLRSRNGGVGGLCSLCPALEQLQNITAFLEANRENRGEAEVGKMCPMGESPAAQPPQGSRGGSAGKGSWADIGGTRAEGWQQKGAPRTWDLSSAF